MNSDTINDLKQFIRAELFQQTSFLENRMDAMDRRFDAMDKRFDAMDRRFDKNDEKQDAILDAIHERFVDVETRVTKLEARAI